MPASSLFAVSNLGRVFSLATDKNVWSELPYLGVEFKRISSHEMTLWALGGDHQVYVFIFGASVPIRVCEETYENQRWSPVQGWSNTLLPTDRAQWSSADGLEERSPTRIHLPTLAWMWEGSWTLHDTFMGHALDKEAWTYAVDFPRTYSAEQRWNSCVRRRKWVRYRRYVALDTWSAVPPVHKDHTQEPFIDIAVGGGEVPGEDADALMVWGVTALARVMVREGVRGNCPEGHKWIHVETAPEQEVTSVSVGRSGRVWAVTWDGAVIVRTGISREHPTGTSWVHVEPPNGSKLACISVGVRVVWAVARDHSIWFRRGLGTMVDSNGETNSDLNSEVGISWLHMVGRLNSLSVGPNDQVIGIGADDYSLYVRTGVSVLEPSGKTWRLLSLPMQPSDSPPSPSPSPRPGSRASWSSGFDSKSGEMSLSEAGGCMEHAMETLFKNSSINVQSGQESLCQKEDKSVKDCVDQRSLAESGVERKCDVEREEIGNESKMDYLNASDMVQSSSSSIVSETIVDFVSQVDDTGWENSYIQEQDRGDCSCKNSGSEKSKENCNCVRQSNECQGVTKEGVLDVRESIASLHFDSSEKVSQEVPSSSYVNDRTKVGEVMSETLPLNCSFSDTSPSGAIPSVTLESPSIHESLCNPNMSDVENASRCNSSDDQSLALRLRHPSNSSSGSMVVMREDSLAGCALLPLQEDHLWVWVTAGGCWITPNNMPKWYSTGSEEQPWRKQILELLHTRHNTETAPFKGQYEEAVEGVGWVVSGQCRWLVSSHWTPASLALSMSSQQDRNRAKLCIDYTLRRHSKMEISLSDVSACLLTLEPPYRPILALYTPIDPLYPHSLLFDAETDAEDWLNHITSGCLVERGITGGPSPYAVWAVTSRGHIYVHDRAVTEQGLRAEYVSAHAELKVELGVPLRLSRGFRPGCFLSLKAKTSPKANRFYINLQTEGSSDIALHINPRIHDGKAVLNTKESGGWGQEKKQPLGDSLLPGMVFEIAIVCDDDDFKISLNDKLWCNFEHRMTPYTITHVTIVGDVIPESLTYNYGAGERWLSEWYWRGIGGHVGRVEGGMVGVTWAISNDLHAYTFTGATHGGLYKGTHTSEEGVHTMSDIRRMYVWENQRWNPLTGFTHRGLPTDRYTWSDQSGRQQRTKEAMRLPSRHWTWTSAWTVDYHTSGGVDKDGWQYATDFPMTYHAHRYVTDLVRRRRWVRKCRLITSGPWKHMDKVALVHVSVSPFANADGTVAVWAVSATGEVVYRHGVTGANPRGQNWELVSAECPFVSVCVGGWQGTSVWGVSKDGRAHLRVCLNQKNPKGTHWLNVDAPPDAPLQEVAVGGGGPEGVTVWGVDSRGILYRRLNTQPLFPEGTAWLQVCPEEVRSISASGQGELWAVLSSVTLGKGEVRGVIGRREGVTNETPGGTGWNYAAGSGWSQVCARVGLPL
ncbi:tectonin beta-propeller repeat-containing protein 1-like isoform X2 [Oratosquilla oratoria]